MTQSSHSPYCKDIDKGVVKEIVLSSQVSYFIDFIKEFKGNGP